MTGRDGIRNYVQFGTLDKDEITFAHMMKDAGYATAVAGKWQLHNGNRGTRAPESGFDNYLLTTKLLDTDQLLKLNENNIKTRDQLADLSNSELIEIFRDMEQDKADEIIMDSRKHWYKN